MNVDIEVLKARLTASVVQDSEGFFDVPDDKEALQITVRITCEFLVFLRKASDPPDAWEAEYVAQTVRSGEDWFDKMSCTGRILSGLKLQYGFRSQLPSSFRELRESYEVMLQRALDATHCAEAFGLLLSLVQMMMIFRAAYYPSFLSFSKESAASS